MTWTNSDGLFIKFAREEGVTSVGGQYRTAGPLQVIEGKIDYTEALSATAAIVDGAGSGPAGIEIPKNFRVEAVETVVETAFTSSGTIASATLVLGLVANDRSTEVDFDGLLTSSATGTALGLATVGTRVYTTKGGTGAGALIGTTLSSKGYLTVNNSAHASHPFTAGKVVVRVYGYYPQTTG